MTRSQQTPFRTLLFRTKDGNKADVLLLFGKGTFTLRRLPNGEEHSNYDVYHQGDISHYISEAVRRWPDLERDGVEWTRDA